METNHIYQLIPLNQLDVIYAELLAYIFDMCICMSYNFDKKKNVWMISKPSVHVHNGNLSWLNHTSQFMWYKQFSVLHNIDNDNRYLSWKYDNIDHD